MDCHRFLPIFWEELSHFSLCKYHTNIPCVCIIFVSMSHMRVSIFIVWMSYKYYCVSITSKWTLHFVSFCVLTDPFLFLSCMDCHISFLTWKILLSYLFSQFLEYNEFIFNSFYISNVIVYIYNCLVFFFLFLRFL